MLLMLLTALFLSALAIFAMARLMKAAMDRFDLDLMTALVWLGLAERPSAPAPPRPKQAEATAAEQPVRRRSPHRSQSGGRRRRAAARPVAES